MRFIKRQKSHKPDKRPEEESKNKALCCKCNPLISWIYSQCMWVISECKWRKLFVFICACHHRCEWTCSLSMIPVGLLLENNLCVLVQGSSVCVSQGHWRIMSDSRIAGCCVPLSPGSSVWEVSVPARDCALLLLLRDHTGTAARWSRPVLLICSLWFWVIIVTRPWWSGEKPQKLFIRYFSAMCEVNMRVATNVKLAAETSVLALKDSQDTCIVLTV